MFLDITNPKIPAHRKITDYLVAMLTRDLKHYMFILNCILHCTAHFLRAFKVQLHCGESEGESDVTWNSCLRLQNCVFTLSSDKENVRFPFAFVSI